MGLTPLSNSKPEIRNSLYTANLLNQYTSRTMPGYADVLGTAHSNATVTVNYERAARKGEYWYKELSLNNQGQAVYAGVTNIAVLNDGANPDIVTTNTGKLFLPQTPEQFTYDDDGNLTGDGRWTYTWDGENRLIQMETKSGAVSASTPKQKLEFAYDDKWRRIQKKVSDWNGSSYTATYTNRFAYDGWNLLAVMNSTAIHQSFLWGKDISGSKQGAGGVGGLLAFSDMGNETHFFAFDGNGNVTSLADSADGKQDAAYEYGPFGEKIQMWETLTQSNMFRYSTKWEDQESGLLYYLYRYLLVQNGAWISRDPIDELGGPLYNLTHNDSVNRYDYLGLCSSKCKSKIVFEYLSKDEVGWFQPENTVYVKSFEDILTNLDLQVGKFDPDGDCCKGSCIEEIIISAHGTGDGTLSLGNGFFFDADSAIWAGKPDESLADGPKQLKEAYLKAKLQLEKLSKMMDSKMCKGGKLRFMVCNAGQGQAGNDLQQQLDGVFPGYEVITYSGSCGFYPGGIPGTCSVGGKKKPIKK